MNIPVIVIIGMAGSGKTTAAAYFQKKNFSVIRMGEVTDKFLIDSGMTPGEKNERYARELLREKFGKDIYARKIIPSILRLLKRNSQLVIDGLRNKEELDTLKKNQAKIKLIFLETDAKIRHNRLQKREQRPLSIAEAKERDKSEIQYFRLPSLGKVADFTVDNNFQLTDLYKKLETILKKINNDQT